MYEQFLKDSFLRTPVSKKNLLSLLLCFCLILSASVLTGCGKEQGASGNMLTESEADALLAESTGKTLADIALENGYLTYDTIDMCDGNSHLQGICVDDELKYMYFSYTSSLAKLDMATGEAVASVGGFGQGSFARHGRRRPFGLSRLL